MPLAALLATAALCLGFALLPCRIHHRRPVRRDLLRAVFPPMDGREAAELYECLRLYFQCDGSVEQAAALACVHPNTFRYRMEKLRRTTGLDVRRPRDTALLYLALQLLDGTPPENPGKPLDKRMPGK